MSVCFTMYQLVDVKRIHCFWDDIPSSVFKNSEQISELENSLGGLNDDSSIEDWNKWYDEIAKSKWSDHQKHDEIYFVRGRIKTSRNYKAQCKKLASFPFQPVMESGRIYKVLPVDEITYFQGNVLKNSFFKRKNTILYFITWKQFENFYKRWMKKCPITKMFFDSFSKKWKDGMIIEVAW